MKILYVGDGRCRINWGAQATSQALYEIMTRDHAISGIVPSSYKLVSSVPVLYSSIFPKSLLYRKIPIRFEIILGKISKRLRDKDFITHDIEQSVRRFLKLKNKYARLNDLYEKIKECDAVVINGEGSIIFSKPTERVALFLVFILRISQQMSKKTFLLNTMISYSPKSSIIDDQFEKQLICALKKCNGIGVRDTFSYNIIKRLTPEIGSVKYIPDALFSWRDKFQETWIEDFTNNKFQPKGILASRKLRNFSFNQSYICISGSSAINNQNREGAIDSFVSLIKRLEKFQVPLLLVPACSGDRFLYKVSRLTGIGIIPLNADVNEGGAILANARVFISGRYHPSILASLGGTPCIFLKSNSHKTLSLQTVLGYESPLKEYDAVPNGHDIENIYKETKYFLRNNSNVRNKILSTVNVLSQKAKLQNEKLLIS